MKRSKSVVKVLVSLFVFLTLFFVEGYALFGFGRNTFKVGATPVPHAEILEFVKDDFKEKTGVELQIVIFTDYVQPNLALEDGSIDANYFQHEPYLETFKRERKLPDLVSVAKIHVEPMGFYLKKELKDLKKGDLIIIPNDVTNEGRSLLLLQEYGVIKLGEREDPLVATIKDIVENPYGLVFKELEAPYLPRTYKEDKNVVGAIINTNYAIEAGLNPLEDAVFFEGAQSPYANIIAVKESRVDDELVKALIEVLTTDKVRKVILEKYNGAVVPVF
ncbi:MetQ/NlpA family ABC transporter substrate-binding protein [Petrotoga olearia]|uniref:Lipoprotein n=2 Tax=Petrotoga olearia TaxID=156203 RepID=A0A2K1P0V3_9BACT|nr:MetQ/NlpA family ABC transporter substrate-binding protein [Petrotoga olearia]PNR96425.1 methionine ABC transporter substrate-binding protein [Petrotoga olearia DSM 13574]RMA76507.1 D-methionine transport system substrate-binding protein [Petrotoga olearia]